MRRVLSVLLIFFVTVAVCVPTFAVPLESESAEVLEDGVEVPDFDPELGILVDSSVVTSVAPVTPSSTSGLKSILLTLLGNYDPIIAEYRYQTSSSGTYSYVREVQPDYVWLCSCGIFAIAFYSVFRMLGAFVCLK